MSEKRGIDIMSIFGGPAESDTASSKDMACKALWKALKRDDYDAFKEALSDYLDYRDDASKDASNDVSEEDD